MVVAMENMESFDTPFGKARWAGGEINGSNHMAKLDTVPITRIMNGQLDFEWVEQPKLGNRLMPPPHRGGIIRAKKTFLLTLEDNLKDKTSPS